MAEVALRATGVVKEYPSRRGPPVRALRGVSVCLPEARTLGVVGESGCGKSTLARVLVGLEQPTSGRIELMGHAAGGHAGPALARRIQLVFQDPFSSLNPRLTVSSTLTEVLAVHNLVTGRAQRRQRVDELLAMVALGPRFLDRYPHELSGGQAQRVAIARALAVEPRLLVLDEPTSALDVSVRAEVMNLLARLQDQLALSYVFISHDLAMVRHISDTISVMYLGKIVEAGPYEAVLGAPLHPYTRALAEAVPLPDPEVEAGRRKASTGEAGALGAEPPGGCPYHPRCPLAEEICRAQVPELVELRPGHEAACHIAARETGTQQTGTQQTGTQQTGTQQTGTQQTGRQETGAQEEASP
jgi:oligopeptide/dipeptide ABC transporter ATP-binding protein